MKVIVVNASHSGQPEGWWYGNPENANECDYVVEERNGEIHAVYTFTGVAGKSGDGRFSFKGMKEETSPMICNRIRERMDV